MFTKYLAAAATAAALSFAVPASATDISFLNGKSSTQTVGGIKVTATGWSTLTTTSQPIFGFVGQYDKGLGVFNKFDDLLTITKNSHTIDNVGAYDFIALSFSKAVRLTDFTLNAFPVTDGKTTDTDAWISFGSGSFGTASGWKGYLDRGIELPSDKKFSNSSNFGTTWLIGASRTGKDRDDGFKLGSIGFTTTAVPEPASWAMMIGGVGLIGGTMRRRRTGTKLATA